ncbi:hypothetical protein BWQ93_11210 [Sphingopyxis sp. QXT-31]|uniref:hypothetical protein n=1 Tax=Sphingopyxis sp. QXT-31 TaxID=1357916 RepID=UPI000979160C|nr:hypothetical protein [Sphingopyxis sp. QXT-31]APZ98995.1 hypothetical protein BWQ93_11210 [Sphingopyxis sp. QXT-31]
MDILLISFGAGVAPAGYTGDCNASGTAGAMLLVMPPVLMLVIWRDRLLAAARTVVDRLMPEAEAAPATS